ncbi:hypothetical protein [Enterovibrio baiacu]|uniref:hypothetical protein n=1 Tax=Enterovibrio baiacu TaxID=2491023 RepID=UPI001012F56F|nr:hypothetical protein [Enterovibrio baiacu]MBE1275006.1 hypothetical protein [Enterovibrio baiacu]
MNITHIEDHIVPQLFTTAIEAYEFDHRAHKKGKANSQLETFGLLWGYTIPAKGEQPARVIATMATVETSALRHQDWVEPQFNSIIAKKAFFAKYWPNIELVGTFHSHPYQDLSEVNDVKGWRASKGDNSDEIFWPYLHSIIAPEQPLLSHLVITITKLEKKGWAYPDRLKGREELKGYVLSAENRKLWLRTYASKMENDCATFSDDMNLEIPSLQNRFW